MGLIKFQYRLQISQSLRDTSLAQRVATGSTMLRMQKESREARARQVELCAKKREDELPQGYF